MDNDTDKDTEMTSDSAVKNGRLFIVLFTIFIFQGILLIICNGSVQIVLFKRRHLRRQYLILLAQIFADISLAFGLCVSGIGRLIMLIASPPRISRQFCLLLPWTVINVWAEPLSATATLMVSVDRLISLLFPVRYFEQCYSYQIKQIIAFFVPIFFFGITAWTASFTRVDEQLDKTGDVLKPIFADLSIIIMITSTSLSVILYIVVYIFSRKHINRIRSNQTETNRRIFESRQKKLTTTMGVSCVFTLIFYVLPMSLKLCISDTDNDPTTRYASLIRISAVISCNLNPLANIASVLVKQDDIACCVWQFFPKCIQKCVNVTHRVTDVYVGNTEAITKLNRTVTSSKMDELQSTRKIRNNSASNNNNH
ncbi:unnamed protein product [Thelazia callipaeda]|uniref:G_PROTEIN_RECEP_F1_2 domain-containing protein n=1 Tax=Thelazia callipaeda TaxID=103827 RepID=A0A0N5D988_THECL|nr:unnamed protein product [Thelazia callipaeda]